MKLVQWPLMGGLLHLVQWGARGLGGTAATVLLYNGPLLCGFNLPINGFGLVTDVFKLCLKSYFSWFSSGLPTPTPLPPHGRIWDVMLVWRKGNIKKTLCYRIVCYWCTKVWAVLTGWSTISGFDLACFSSLSSQRIYIFGFHGAILYSNKILVTSFLNL